MVAYIYARVSTAEQMLNGQSLEGQVKSCRDYCTSTSLVLASASNCDSPGVIIDGGRSAYKKSFETRPGALLLANSVRPGDTVVVTSLTRLFRRVSDACNILERWVESGVHVTFVDYPSLSFNSANGRCLVYCMAAVAQLKSELISARIREANARKRDTTSPPQDRRPAGRPPVPPSQLSAVETLRIMAATPAAVPKGRTFLYARVSTDDQSASTQLQILRQKYPDALEFVDEGVSAWKTPLQNRPAGGQMLQILQPGDVVVALRPDRLFRSLKDAANQIDAIHAKGAILAIAESGIRTDDLFGKLLMGMLSAFAQLESEETSRATKHAAAIALATNENLLQQRLPRALSNRIPLRQKHYVFQDVFTPQEMSDLWLKVYLTYRQYRNVPACVSCVCNQALHEKGLPPLIAMPYTDAAEYARALRRKGTAICKRVAAVVEGHTHVASPVNPNRFLRNAARFKKFMDIHQQLPREQRSLTLTEMFRNHPAVIGVVSAAANSAAD